MPELQTCACGNQFNPWFSRDKGKPQKFPYKQCFSCKQKQTQPDQPQNGRVTTELMILEELQGIRQVLERYLSAVVNKDVVKSFETPKTVSEDETPEIDQIPF